MSHQLIGILKRLLIVIIFQHGNLMHLLVKLLNILLHLIIVLLQRVILIASKTSWSLFKVTFTHKQVVNIYILNEINLRSHTQGADFTLENSLFGAAKLIKNVDPDKCSFSGYSIRFNTCGNISLPGGCRFGKNVIMYELWNIPILGKGQKMV